MLAPTDAGTHIFIWCRYFLAAVVDADAPIADDVADTPVDVTSNYSC